MLYDLTNPEGITTVPTDEILGIVIADGRFAVIRPAMAMTQ